MKRTLKLETMWSGTQKPAASGNDHEKGHLGHYVQRLYGRCLEGGATIFNQKNHAERVRLCFSALAGFQSDPTSNGRAFDALQEMARFSLLGCLGADSTIAASLQSQSHQVSAG
jgi:hypothetical protein